ncbi:MAG: hypothetical protein JNM19_19010 [Chitinophagaceae bacterium]|nr:hypothetical protein [Chitinophagaceae bacterium]
MQSTLQHQARISANQSATTHLSLWRRFIKWADGQENSRIFWTAIAIAGHGCVFTIVTMAAILFTGNNFIFWPFAIAAMSACVVTNLAAMPTKITIPVFFFSLLVDLVIIVLCLTQGFDLAGTYR